VLFVSIDCQLQNKYPSSTNTDDQFFVSIRETSVAQSNFVTHSSSRPNSVDKETAFSYRLAVRHPSHAENTSCLDFCGTAGATDVYKRCRKSTSRQQTSYKSVNQSKSIPRDRRAVCSRDRAINVAHSWPTPTSGLSLLSTAHAPRDGWKEKPDRLLHGACGDSDKAHKA